MKKRSFNFVFGFIISGFLMLVMIPFQGCVQKNPDVKHDTVIIHDTIIQYDTVVKHDTVINRINNNSNNNSYNNQNNNINNTKSYKPNIYIYPEKEISLKVSIAFPKGGSVDKSIPEYNDGWYVKVDSTGKIDNTYGYLFYESTQPDGWQHKSGWLIEKDSLKDFFQENMVAYGFNAIEIKDFTDYWIPKFTAYKYYMIYPQEKDIIDNLIEVSYSVKPDNILRLFYMVKGTNEKLRAEKPLVNNSFKRDGFYTAEWGVVIK
jgi:hypothetical protein